MKTLPKVSAYSLVPGRQSCCILETQTLSLQRRHVYFNDGAYIRLDRSMLLATRGCGNKRGGTNYSIAGPTELSTAL